MLFIDGSLYDFGSNQRQLHLIKEPCHHVVLKFVPWCHTFVRKRCIVQLFLLSCSRAIWMSRSVDLILSILTWGIGKLFQNEKLAITQILTWGAEPLRSDKWQICQVGRFFCLLINMSLSHNLLYPEVYVPNFLNGLEVIGGESANVSHPVKKYSKTLPCYMRQLAGS